MRITGTIELDGLYVVFNQGTSTQTTLQAVAPASNIVLSLPNTADTLAGIAATQTLTNKTINAANNTISDLTVAMLAAGVLNTSATLTGATDSQVPSALATKTYADNAVVSGLAAKADKTTTISAGTGLTGGGDLSANRTIALADTAVTLGSYGSATQVATFTVDQQGRLTAASNTSIQIAQSQVTNLVTDLAGKQAADVDLDALAALSTTGLIARTGAGTAATRTITQPAAGITVTDGDGVAGNPTLALANDLSALEGLSGTGIAVRTAADTWAQRTITAGTGISVTDGNGVAGNPTVAIDSTVATLSGTQVLTNKDYDGGTASNSRRLTVPKDTYTNLLALTRKEGTLLYATDQDILYSDDGTNLNAVGSGSGSGTGSLNIVDNPSAASATTGWTAATNYTVTRNTTNSPLAGVIDTCFDISTTTASSESSTSGVYAPALAMPLALRNAKNQVNFYVTTPSTSGVVWKVSVYNAGGTRMALSTDSGGSTSLPSGFTGQFITTFDADNTAQYTLSFTQTAGAGGNSIFVTNIVIGPGSIGSVPAVGRTQDVTVTGSWVANTTYTAKETQVNQWAEYEVQVTLTGAPTSAALTINLPSGRTIDTTALVSTNTTSANILPGSKVSMLDSGTASFAGEVGYNNTTSVKIYYLDDTASALSHGTVTQAAPFTWANGDTLTISFKVPIAEWAGSVSTGPAPVEEFAYNSSTTNTDDTTSFAYGPSGGSLISSDPASGGCTKRVRFQYPIQADDEVVLEVAPLGDGKWVQLPALDSGQFPLEALHQESTNFFGLGIYMTSGLAAAEIAVKFGQYPDSHTTDSSGYNWSNYSAWKWRVRKTKKASLPFANAGTDGSAGLYKAGQAPGQASNIAIGTGYIGEKLSVNAGSPVTPSGSDVYSNITALTLTAGVWMVRGTTTFNPSSTTYTRLIAGISTSSGTVDSTNVGNWAVMPQSSSLGTTMPVGHRYITVAAGATQSIYLVGAVTYSVLGSATWTTNSYLEAVRIA